MDVLVNGRMDGWICEWLCGWHGGWAGVLRSGWTDLFYNNSEYWFTQSS